jgi:hypothetical protein
MFLKISQPNQFKASNTKEILKNIRNTLSANCLGQVVPKLQPEDEKETIKAATLYLHYFKRQTYQRNNWKSTAGLDRLIKLEIVPGTHLAVKPDT